MKKIYDFIKEKKLIVLLTLNIISITIATVSLIFSICMLAKIKKVEASVPTETVTVVEKVPETTEAVTEPVSVEETTVVEEVTVVPTTSDNDYVSYSDVELIALLTMAEAEGESEYGKRLVIDTILNRMDHSAWPNTVSGVVYQANQFSPMSDGRINRCYVSEYYCNLVREELESRTNYDVVYFRTTRYSDYGTPLFQEGNHYFSSY